MDLIATIEANRAALVEQAAASVSRAHLGHYASAGPDALRARLATLLDRLLASLRTRELEPIVEHARAIARDRFDAGYPLAEVQVAMRALEEALWLHVFAAFPSDDVARPLALVTTTLSAGRDALARTYVALAQATHAPAVDVDSLFSGVAA